MDMKGESNEYRKDNPGNRKGTDPCETGYDKDNHDTRGHTA